MVGSLGFVVPSHTQNGQGPEGSSVLAFASMVGSLVFLVPSCENPKSKLFFVTPKIQTCENGQRPEGTEEQNPKYL